MLTPFTHYYPYNINISTGVFSVLYDYIKRHYDFSQVYILLDENIKEFCFPILIRDFPIFNKVKRIQISSGESFKSIVIPFWPGTPKSLHSTRRKLNKREDISR